MGKRKGHDINYLDSNLISHQRKEIDHPLESRSVSHLHLMETKIQFLRHLLQLRAEYTVFVENGASRIKGTVDNIHSHTSQFPTARKYWNTDRNLRDGNYPKTMVVYGTSQRYMQP